MGGRGGSGNRKLKINNDTTTQKTVKRQDIQKTFQVVETGHGIQNSSFMLMTEKEMSNYLKGRRENIGYIPGLGGDRTYSINAWTVDKEGNGYIDMDKIWKRYKKRRK